MDRKAVATLVATGDHGSLPCVLNPGDARGTRWPFRRPDGLGHVRVSGRFSTDTGAAAVAASRAGAGFGLSLSDQVAHDLRAGRRIRLLRDAEPEPEPVRLVHAAPRHVPRRTAVVLDELGRALSGRLRSIASELARGGFGRAGWAPRPHAEASAARRAGARAGLSRRGRPPHRGTAGSRPSAGGRSSCSSRA